MNKFQDVKDIYLQERLYAIAYGVTLFSEDKIKVKKIVSLVYKNIFDKKVVYSNILIRDSAYGILMYAKSLGIDLVIEMTKVEPPYNYPKIKRYPSDNYIKHNYDTYPEDPYEDKTLYSKFNIERSTNSHSDFMRYKVGDYFLDDWVDAPKRKQMCNWLCKKSYNFGWNYEKHGKFDYNVRRNIGREEGNIERIGKKYQWIAFHEYICNLMDNYLYKEKYVDETPRQSLLSDFKRRRNFDPTFLISNIEDYSDWQNMFIYWTHPNIRNKKLFLVADLKKQEEWLKETQNNICILGCII